MDWNLRLQRATDLEVNEGAEGFLVYQRSRDRLHVLNPAAALVLEGCDGKRRARELPELVAAAFGVATVPAAEIETCITQLLGEGLLVAVEPPSEGASGRRARR